MKKEIEHANNLLEKMIKAKRQTENFCHDKMPALRTAKQNGISPKYMRTVIAAFDIMDEISINIGDKINIAIKTQTPPDVKGDYELFCQQIFTIKQAISIIERFGKKGE